MFSPEKVEALERQIADLLGKLETVESSPISQNNYEAFISISTRLAARQAMLTEVSTRRLVEDTKRLKVLTWVLVSLTFVLLVFTIGLFGLTYKLLVHS